MNFNFILRLSLSTLEFFVLLVEFLLRLHHFLVESDIGQCISYNRCVCEDFECKNVCRYYCLKRLVG